MLPAKTIPNILNRNILDAEIWSNTSLHTPTVPNIVFRVYRWSGIANPCNELRLFELPVMENNVLSMRNNRLLLCLNICLLCPRICQEKIHIILKSNIPNRSYSNAPEHARTVYDAKRKFCKNVNRSIFQQDKKIELRKMYIYPYCGCLVIYPFVRSILVTTPLPTHVTGSGV